MEQLTHTTTDTIDPAEQEIAGEEILTHTLSDEALEAAAGTERGGFVNLTRWQTAYYLNFGCCI